MRAHKLFSYWIFFLLVAVLVSAVTYKFTPLGDIDGRGVLSVVNMSYVNATSFFQGGVGVVDASDVTGYVQNSTLAGYVQNETLSKIVMEESDSQNVSLDANLTLLENSSVVWAGTNARIYVNESGWLVIES